MNRDYVIYDSTGKILRTGSVPAEAWDLQVLEPGEFKLDAKACCENDTVCTIDKCVLPGTAIPLTVPEPVVPPASPALSTADQLDLLWQAMDAGTFPKAEPFYSAIKAQKDAAA